ncbi:hypothetical protein J2D73_19075 [Acetobacter sacchari]|uniref:Uncharacterized protein n=1 Tax=Acetobacter sacchari TaxID=2661687 RepID=A0ABS3M131_9PROT|nr:hypothetical protein [Acetobacter sacchari]
MGHNYAKPLTPEQKLARVLTRVPADWVVSIEREGKAGLWKASVHPVGGVGEWATDAADISSAVEEAWRLNRSSLA